VLSVSKFTKQKLCAWSGLDESKISVVPNSFQPGEFSPGERSEELLNRYRLHGKKIILTLARLSTSERYKGIDEVLSVLPELLASTPNLVYMIAGEGSDRARLEQRVHSEGVEQYVRFCGFVKESEKADHYRLADAFVMPGWGEGFGIVYLEALACGIPVVASKLDGSCEAVRDGMLGVTVDPRDRRDLVGGIQRALATKRHVPEGLDYFGYTRFTERVRKLVEPILKVSSAE
jgi:glycosyltransferase involved in cell wall biosynthesis